MNIIGHAYRMIIQHLKIPNDDLIHSSTLGRTFPSGHRWLEPAQEASVPTLEIEEAMDVCHRQGDVN